MSKIFRYTFIFNLFFVTLFLPVSAGAAGVSLEFVPDKVSAEVGESEEIILRLNPNGEEVIGVDMIFEFDALSMKVVSISNLGIFSRETGKAVDNEGGVVKYALSNSWGKYQKDGANIAKVVFEGISEKEKTEVRLRFLKGDTTDTNVVVKHGLDVLEEVNLLSVKIKKEKKDEKILASESSGEDIVDKEIDEKVDRVDGIGNLEGGIEPEFDREIINGREGEALKGEETLNGKVAGVSSEKNLLWIPLILYFLGWGVIGLIVIPKVRKAYF